MAKKITAILTGLGGLITAVALLLNALNPYLNSTPAPVAPSTAPQGYVQPVRDSLLVIKSFSELPTATNKGRE